MASFDDVLAGCGVTATTLSAREAQALDRDGFVVLERVADPAWLAQMRAAFEAACARAGTGTDRPETGTRHPSDLVSADPAFEHVLTAPRVLAAVQHVLRRPFQLLFLSGRDPLPGFGQQGLHTDWTPRAPRDPFDVVTAIWPLDDFARYNGATRVLPGSHLVPRALPKSMQGPEARHPDQVLVLARAGSVLVFNAHLWHSATLNSSRGPRRALQCQWVARDRARPGDVRPFPDHLGRAARALLGA